MRRDPGGQLASLGHHFSLGALTSSGVPGHHRTRPRAGSPSSGTGQGTELRRRSQKPTGPMDTGRRGEAAGRWAGGGGGLGKGVSTSADHPQQHRPVTPPQIQPQATCRVSLNGQSKERATEAQRGQGILSRPHGHQGPRLTHISTTNPGPGSGATWGTTWAVAQPTDRGVCSPGTWSPGCRGGRGGPAHTQDGRLSSP